MVKLLPYVNIFLLRLTLSQWTFRLGDKGVQVVGASNLEEYKPLTSSSSFHCHLIFTVTLSSTTKKMQAFILRQKPTSCSEQQYQLSARQYPNFRLPQLNHLLVVPLHVLNLPAALPRASRTQHAAKERCVATLFFCF